jgi:hypothetical protein
MTQLNKRLHSLRMPDVGVYFLTALLAAAYVLLWNKYRPYNIDDSWFSSFSYNLCHKHSELDDAFGGRFPNGMGGTVVFGKLAAYPQCVLYDLFGWTLNSLQIFAKLTSLGGVTLIALALLKAGFERSLVWLFVISFIAMEPFFNMANQGRYESVTFLFMGAALLLVSYGRITFAGFISAAAVEIQPIGIVVPLFAAIFLLTTRPGSRREMVRSCLRLAAGGLAFVPFYFLLHPNAMDAITHPDKGGTGNEIYLLGFLHNYFIDAKYYRHIPELALFTISIFLYIKNRNKIDNKFAIYSFISLTTLSLVTGWGNFNYTVFWYFPALLLAFQIAQSYRMAAWLCLVLLLYVVPQYAVAYMLNRHSGFTQADITKISEQIRKVAATDQRPLNIFGDYALWFADPTHYNVAGLGTVNRAGLATMAVCRDVTQKYLLSCDQIGQLVKLVPVSIVDLPSSKVKLFLTEATVSPQR